MRSQLPVIATLLTASAPPFPWPSPLTPTPPRALIPQHATPAALGPLGGAVRLTAPGHRAAAPALALLAPDTELPDVLWGAGTQGLPTCRLRPTSLAARSPPSPLPPGSAVWSWGPRMSVRRGVGGPLLVREGVKEIFAGLLLVSPKEITSLF